MELITVDWMEGFANNPHFVLESPAKPVISEGATYTKRDGIHLTTLSDPRFVSFFYTDGNPTSGFGGAPFRGTLDTGESFNYIGAWSSRAGVVNKLFPEAPVVEMHHGHSHRAMYVRDFIDIYRQSNPNFGLAVCLQWGEPTVLPTKNGLLKNEHQILCHLDSENTEQFMKCFLTGSYL